MAFNSRLLILLLSILLALSSSAIKMVAAGRRHHHRHRRLLKSRETVDAVPFSSIPWIVPAVYDVSWDFNVKDWPHDSGITFRAGDILDMHNVIPVDEANYLKCIIPEDPVVYTSGHDPVVLGPGTNYFICGAVGHCSAGMLINVTAA